MQTGSIKKILKRIQIELDFVKYSEKMGYRNWLKKPTQIFLLIDKHNTQFCKTANKSMNILLS